MKDFKKVLVLSIMLCLYFPAVFSQTDEEPAKKTQLIVKGGINFSNIAISDKEGKYNGTEKSRIGYNIGLATDMPLGKKFYFQPNLSLSSKGSKLRKVSIDRGIADLSMNALYTQITLLFAYKFDLKKWNNSFNIALGPYVAYGVGGNITGSSIKTGTFGTDGLCNTIDAGMSMELQLELPKIIFILGGESGFTDMIKTEALLYDYQNRLSIHNLISYIGIGYKF